MEKSFDFVLGTSDPEVTNLLKAQTDGVLDLDRRFTQQEEFYLTLRQPFQVGSFEVHHDVQNPTPSPRYLEVIRSVVRAWTAQLPGLFQGLSWFFDPKDLFHPQFIQVLTARDKRYLYLLRADLTYRGRYAEMTGQRGNSTTPAYRTNALFLESEILPLDSIETLPTERRLRLIKLFPFTWQGETGRGYFITGRWLDQEITKLLSRAALTPGTRIFPCYPLRCRYETLSSFCPTPTSEGRRRSAAALEAAWPLVSPWADHIQTELRTEPYREDHPLVESLRSRWAGRLESRWGAFRLEPYLNESEQKEYRYYGD